MAEATGTAITTLNRDFAAERREHQAALERAMTGAPMIGDPRFNDLGGNILLRRACLYAAEMVRGRDMVPEDMSGLDAIFLEPATVVFARADAGQQEIARYTISEHVMTFGQVKQPAPQLEPPTITIEPNPLPRRPRRKAA